MKILLTGASGFVGAYVLREALRRDHEVIALVHQNPISSGGESGQNVKSLRFELGGEERFDIRALNLDAIVHLAAALDGDREHNRRTLLDGSKQLVEAAIEAGVKTLVCVSSVAVVDYASMPEMSLIDESSRLLPGEESDGSYALLKSRQEVILEDFCGDDDGHLVILRAGLVYDECNLSVAHAGLVKPGFAVLATHAGSVPVIEATSLAATVIDAVEQSGSGRDIYQLVDDDLPSQARYIEELRRRKLLQRDVLKLSWRMLAGIATICRSIASLLGLGRRLPELLTSQGFAGRLKPFRFTNAKARQAFGRAYKGGF